MRCREFSFRGRTTKYAPCKKKGRKEVIMNILRNYRNWRRYRETVNELSRLSNRELSDLGITRSDIEAVAARGRA